ncbi:MAG: class I SAM-dependent methyltransferase [Thermodesulfobacteriota bacterium]
MIKYDYIIDRSNPNYAANRILALVRPGARVLDVGCSSGYLASLLRDEFSCRVTGIELDAEAAAKAAAVCDRVVVGDVEELPGSLFADNSFDIIIFADVLEHLRDPRAVLAKVVPWLGEEGFVVVSIPNFGYKGVLLGLADGRLERTSHGILDDTHVQFFALPEIFTLLAGAGLLPVVLDRTVKGIADSEFARREFALPDELQALIDQGPEVDTYQFIVKACPAGPASLPLAARFMADMVLQHGELSKEYHGRKKFLQQVIDEKKRMITDRDGVIAEKNSVIAAMQETIDGKNGMIRERDEVISRKNEMIRVRDEAIRTKNEQIARLTEELNRRWTSRLINAVRKKNTR